MSAAAKTARRRAGIEEKPQLFALDERETFEPRRDDREPGAEVLEELVGQRKLRVSGQRPVEENADVVAPRIWSARMASE